MRGLALLAPPLLGFALFWKGIGAGQLAAMGGTARTGIYGLALLVGGVMFSVGIHLVLRAFEVGINAEESDSRDIKS